jgi:rare lipoprotein A
MRIAALAVAAWGAAAGVAAAGCGASAGLRPEDVRSDQIMATEHGEASWYGARHHGRRTASGEPFDMYALTAAHRTLPFGTLCRVTSLRSGRAVIVRINDRGPFSKGRIMDLSRAAAEVIDMIRAGHVPVTVDVLAPLGR